jgi:molybdate/tungstate transport system ATP-binding protein
MLTVKNLNYSAKSFSLKNISLSVGKGEYFVLLGPTASGKTLLLKNIAGLITPSSGEISWEGENFVPLPSEERGFVYLAQDYCLFPHLDVRRNILFSPRIRKFPSEYKEELLKKLSALLGINNILDRRVDKLSGGEKQRVALARALAASPKAVLLDEPFSAIDTGLKRHLWFEIKSVLVSMGVAVIHVTHDIEEAMTMGDSVAMIIGGEIVQYGSPPEDILLHPSSEDVARYLGIKNIYYGKVSKVLPDADGRGFLRMEVDCSDGKIITLSHADRVFPCGEEVTVCVRPQSVKILRPDEPIKKELLDNVSDGVIVKAFFYSGESASVFIKSSGGSDNGGGGLVFEARFPQAIYKRYNLSVGKRLSFSIWQPDIMVYKRF